MISCREKVERKHFQPYVIGPVPAWKKFIWERHGYKDDIKFHSIMVKLQFWIKKSELRSKWEE